MFFSFVLFVWQTDPEYVLPSPETSIGDNTAIGNFNTVGATQSASQRSVTLGSIAPLAIPFVPFQGGRTSSSAGVPEALSEPVAKLPPSIKEDLGLENDALPLAIKDSGIPPEEVLDNDEPVIE